MYRPSRLKLLDVNPNLICVLCGGYFVDATTIVECLHSFCKTCIVRYLETSKYCPICDVQVHKSKPLQNIRSDQTLQNIVYKLVPGLFQNEMRQRREFYALHPEAPASEYDAGIINEETSHIFSPDETVALCLEYSRPSHNPQVLDSTKQSDQHCSSSYKECHQHQQHRRYLRCPAAVTVSHLKKLLRSKYGLSPDHRVDLMYNDELLREDFSLMDVAYVYLWRRKGPMHLTYRIFERPRKRRKLDLERDKVSLTVGVDILKNNLVGSVGEVKLDVDTKPDCERVIPNQILSVQELELRDKTLENDKVKSDCKLSSEVDERESNEEWKEVQLQISENGVMSVRNIDDLVSAVEVGVIGGAFNETIISSGKVEEKKDDLGKTGLENSLLGDKDVSDLSEKKSDAEEVNHGASLDKQQSKDLLKDSIILKSVDPVESIDASGPLAAVAPSSKVNVVDKVSGPRVCDVSKHSFSKKEANIKPKEVKNKEVSNDNGTSLVTSEGIPLTNSPQPGATVSTGSVSPSVTLTPIPSHTMQSSLPVTSPIPKKPNSSPVGYKTLKTPPKTWNPSIPRASFLANHATFGKTPVGGNVNGNISTPGQSASSKLDGKADGKVNSTSSEGSSGTSNGVRLPPTSSPKPLRFFKMRNNMPRYLGNPSSGVKPMYQVQPGGGASAAAPISPKPPLSTTKGDSKVNSAPQLPTSSTMTDCKQDKSGSVSSKVTFLVTPSSKGSPKSSSGMNSATGSSHGQSVPTTFSHTPVSSASTSHITQLPSTRTSQSTSPYAANTTLPSSGYHPSLPPSISMIFGPSRPGATERPTSQTPPPAVQRVPASVHHPHHFHHPLPVAPIHHLQPRQAGKTAGKLNGDLSNSEVKSSSKSGILASANVGSPVLDTHKGKEGPSREGAKDPPVNGKIEGSSTAAKTPPVVEGKSMAPSKC